MAEWTLRCNSLKCREQLLERAVVTTCSHIFCESCAHNLGLSLQTAGPRHCPACTTQLNNPDDAVLAVLKPPDDYKTSVLSGLSPSTIMECAARGLAFWSYQITQEIKYQSYLGQSLTERYQNLNDQTDRIVHEANNEIKKLQDKLKVSNEEQAQLLRTNNELQNAYKDKSKAFSDMRKLYQTAKAKEMATQVQDAADNDADNTLLTAAATRSTRRLPSAIGATTGSLYSNIPIDSHGVEHVHRHHRSGAAGCVRGNEGLFVHNSHSYHQDSAPTQTPLAHRTRLPVPQRTRPSATTPFSRQPMMPLSTNIMPERSNSHLNQKFAKPGDRQTPVLSRASPAFQGIFR